VTGGTLRIVVRVLASLACSIAAPLAASPLAFNAVELRTPNAPSLSGTDISARGDVVGYTHTPQAFLYIGGTFSLLATPGTPSAAVAINDRGDIVGSFESSDGIHSFLFSNGVMQDLGRPQVTDIDALGRVVGYYTPPGTANTLHAFAYLGGTFRDLGTLGGSGSVARAVNGAGLVVGSSSLPGDPTSHAFLYSVPLMIDLGTLPGTDISAAYGINDHGEIVGESYSSKAPDKGRAVLWRDRVAIDLGTLGGTHSSAWRINGGGQIVGTSAVAGDVQDRAFLHTGGVMYDLNVLVLSGLDGAVLSSANGINDSGQIVANACVGPTYALVCRAFRLDPVALSPESAAIVPVNAPWALAVLIALVLASAAWRRRRRR